MRVGCLKGLASFFKQTSCVFALLSSNALFFPAFSNPENPNIVAGIASVSQNGSKLDVHQQTERTVIDWRKFNIESGEHTEFHQPSRDSIALNRVKSSDPSHIFGKLSANGNIVLVNPNGVLFGKDSQVDVNGIIATSADIETSAFMNGSQDFNKPGSPHAIIANEGVITAKEAGLVGLVAPRVINDGIIEAKLGRVQLSSGDTLTADFYGDGLLKVEVADKEVHTQLVENTGLLSAPGGTISMTSSAARQTIDSLLVVSGELKAPSIEKRGGKIIISAAGSNKNTKSGNSTVVVKAKLDVSGRSEKTKGGKIEISADKIAVLNGTVIDASGTNNNSSHVHSSHESSTVGINQTIRSEDEFMNYDDRAGGSIKIGGDYLGLGDMQTAKDLLVEDNVLIFNDAIDYGDGGRTIFWADDTTEFNGLVFARGGRNTGDGGFVETSGHGFLKAEGFVDLSAQEGYLKGTYFLDPTNITIYGNVSPDFLSTDSSINLANNLKLWLDPADRNTVLLTYSNNSLSGATASGSAGGHTIITSANVSSFLAVGARIRLNSTGSINTANTLGADTYTIAAISGTTITTVESLSANYAAGTSLYRGLASSWNDKSTSSNNAQASNVSIMPLWVGGKLNGKDVLSFDGVNDMMTVNDSASLDNTSGLSIFAVNTPYNLDGNPRAILSKRIGVDNQQSYSLAYFTSNQIFADVVGSNNRFFSNVSYTSANTNLIGLIYDGTLAAANRVKYYNMGLLDKTSSESSASIPDTTSDLYLGTLNNAYATYLNGDFSDTIIYSSALSSNERNLVEQYLSAKWNKSLDPINGAGAEATEAMDVTSGYSVFTTRYLERLSQTANISLQASNNITLDLKGDTLSLGNDRNLNLSAGNNIVSNSSGSIVTTRGTTGGNITMSAGGSGSINLSGISLNSNNGGSVNITSAGSLTLGSINAGTISARSSLSTSDVILPSGKTLTSSSSGSSLVVSAGRHFINSSGAGAFNSANGQWLIYSSNPTDTLGEETLINDFNRYGCTYLSGCVSGVSIPNSGNGLIYSYQPTLNLSPTDPGFVYGDAVGSLSTFSEGSYLNALDQSQNTFGGVSTFQTTYIQGNTAGSSYSIANNSSSLYSHLGYLVQFSTTNGNVSKRNVTASFTSSLDRYYGESNPTLSYADFTFGNLYQAGDNALFTSITPNWGGANIASNVADGPFNVSASIADTANYTLVNTPSTTLTIHKALLNTSLPSQVYIRMYGSKNPSLSLRYTGFKLGEDVGNIDTLPFVNTLADESSAIGMYPINLLGGLDDNYTFIYNDPLATIVILPVSLPSTWEQAAYGQNTDRLSFPHFSLLESNFYLHDPQNLGFRSSYINEGI